MPALYIGLMSGTSLDGVDAVLVDLAAGKTRQIAAVHQAFSVELRNELLALHSSGMDELARAARAAQALSKIYAECIADVLAQCPGEKISAIGCHGQTVRHQPGDSYTIQLVNGALLAELTSIDVVCDFRSRDIAAGGEGAPLVPAFHYAAFADSVAHRVIVNIGGIANITNLPPAGNVTGFDCGPGNMLLDAWTQRHRREPYDRDGAWAVTGHVISDLLERLLADHFFARTPPKSCGREQFNIAWLTQHLSGNENPANVQATLLTLTATSIAGAIAQFCNGMSEIFLCGGGARNTALVRALSQQLSPRKVAVTDVLGIQAEHVEATAFAWLAKQTLEARPGNLPAVTGARGPRILGAIYRA
jgi:anhydro-N-acetylmuramic acid kinase